LTPKPKDLVSFFKIKEIASPPRIFKVRVLFKTSFGIF
jgi:hypothetical protein